MDSVELESRRAKWILVTAALIGAGAAWWPAHRAYRVYPFLGKPSSVAGLDEKDDLSDMDRRRLKIFSFRGRATDVAAVMAYFGGLVGATVGLARGLVVGKAKTPLIGLICGGTIGAIAGAGAGVVGEWVFESLQSVGGTTTFLKTTTFHAAAFAIVGFFVGASFAVFGESRANVIRRAIGGAIGGVLGAALFGPVCAIVCPLAQTGFFVPDIPSARLVWFLVTALGIGIGLVAAIPAKPAATVGTSV